MRNEENTKIFYVAEFSLPNMSAYSLHVLKMCDALSELGYDLTLILNSCNKRYNFSKIKIDYLLKSKFKIESTFNKKKKFNLLRRIIFAKKCYNILKKKKNSLIITRSPIVSLYLSLFKIHNILEIHTELTGISKHIFDLFNKMNLDNKIKYILLNKNLIKILNLNKKKNIILYDAVDVRDFKNLHNDKIKNSCVYAGSFAKGKGLEIIEKIANVSPKIQFHLYGNKNTLYKSIDNYPNNIKFKGYVSYSKLTKVLPKYKVLLMPYEKEVGVLMKKINVVSYFSPLKLFEYMATGSCILASKLKVYQNILKHNQNSILIEHSDINTWSKNIFKVLNSNVNKIGKKAKIDANKYTWLKRAKNIISFYEN